MRIAASNTFKSPEFLTKLSKGRRSPTGIEVEVTDLETNSISTYHAIKAAARALDIDKRYIEHYIYLNQDKPVLVEVTNVDTQEVTVYSSITAAAKALGYRQPSISLYLKENRTRALGFAPASF
ncbi:hypothetical protein Tco_1463003 [Tanacetum coccineum]